MDPYILLGYVNTQLRDYYPSLEELCAAKDLPLQGLKDALSKAGFEYDPDINQFR